MSRQYSHYAGLTSQIGFCSVPLRLDAFNRCQFSCDYCFAATRQGHGRKQPLKFANPEALKARLLRVSNGDLASSLDEFLYRRIPIQFGGMSDPFIKKEESTKVSLQLLRVLGEHRYPVLISTKSDLVASEKYLELLKESNVLVRFSLTLVDETFRRSVDRGCPSITRVMRAIEKLSGAGIASSVRVQPVIPGFENCAGSIMAKVAAAGARHVSVEYLKVPIDADRKFGDTLRAELGGRPIRRYLELGATRKGREYILPKAFRTPRLVEIAEIVRRYGMTIGFADNEFLLHSDGRSCCNGSRLYLKAANFFDANPVGVATDCSPGDLIRFKDLKNRWYPKFPVSRYFNSTARISEEEGRFKNSDWVVYARNAWISNRGIYSPCFFDGVRGMQQLDDEGLPIFERYLSRFESMLRERIGPRVERV